MTPLSFDYPISVAILAYSTRGKDGEDTRETINAIVKALEERGHKVRVAEVKKNNWLKHLRTPGEVVFNMVEDESWELYYKIGKKLVQMGRAVVGMDALSLLGITDKAKMMRKLKASGVRVPAHKIITRGEKIHSVRSLNFPLIVKPAGEHSGWGISQDSVVIDLEELNQRIKYLNEKFSGDVIVEEFIDGREIHATVIGNQRHNVVLPYIEVEFNGEFENNWTVYTYDAKWEENTWEYWDTKEKIVLKLEKDLDKRVQDIAKKAFKVSNCKDIARIDIRIDERNRPYVVDVNSSPSMNPLRQSPSVRSAEALGWTYDELVETLVVVCYKRNYGKMPDRLRERELLLNMPRMLG